MKNIAKIGIIFMVALLAACQSEYDVIENGVFLTDAQKSQSKKVTIDDTEPKLLSLPFRYHDDNGRNR